MADTALDDASVWRTPAGPWAFRWADLAMNAVAETLIDDRLRVALADGGQRTHSLLRAYLNGSGRHFFETVPPDQAQCLIIDHDHAAGRQALQRFRDRAPRPAIVLAMRDPGVPDTVWVPKPVDLDALDHAAQQLRHRLLAPMPGEGAGDALIPWARLPPAASMGLARTTRAQPEAAGPYRIGGRADWTAKIGWMALGVLAIAALTSALGWRPATEGWRPAAAAVRAELPGALPPADRLQQAVSEALQQAQRPRPDEQERLKALLAERAADDALPPRQLAWLGLGGNPDVLNVSAHTLPAALMAEAPATVARTDREAAIRRAVREALAP